ncbi:sigma-70 family RNA polymerase sigma factor, partial [Candidatus Peregrinibacteria bacterium]|nr:sigma-70 family RNA polymerase sigma factor [Candidatus Peregrinibacteria bacterium]
PLYLQEYLHSAGWRGAGEERETAQEREAKRDVRELLARSIVTFVESIIVLPPPLREFLAHRVSEDGRLPRREELVVHMAAQGMGETDVHVAWLADRHMEAKNLLILSNMRFAVYKARQCCGRGIEMDDVIQESVLGLMEAANHFEPHRGGTFIYFAARRVRAKIRAECIAQRGIVRRSPSVWTEIVALERCEGALRGTLGRTPSPEELGEALSWAVETVKRVQQASMQGAVSIDTVIGGDEDDGRTLGETIADPGSMDDVLEQEYHRILHDLLMEALKGLPEREREIVILRHGLRGGPPYTLQQAADILKLTRERVRQFESCGEARLIRIIARRFPHLLPEGMTPELAMVLADQKDWRKKTQERKRKVNIGPELPMTSVEKGEAPPQEDGAILLERAIRWAFLTHTGIASTYYAVLRERALEVVEHGGTFTDIQRALQEKIDALAMRGEDAVS